MAVKGIKAKMANSLVWISIDATKDPLGRPVANIILGKLDATQAHEPLLAGMSLAETI